MKRPSIARLIICVGGVALIGVGLFNALNLGFVDLLWLGFWLAAGLLVHDAVLAPGTAGLSKLAADRWPAHRRRIPLIAVVAIGSLTLIALPLIKQQDSVTGNATLLGRNYFLGWALACLLVLVGAAMAAIFRRVQAGREPSRAAQSGDPG